LGRYLERRLLHILEETEKREWEKKYDMVFGADGAFFTKFDTACNAKVCLTIHGSFLNMGYKRIKYPCKS
jgi:hypothetical protein